MVRSSGRMGGRWPRPLVIPGPEGMQRLLNFYAWDTDGVRDDVRAAVVEAIGDAEDGVLIVDETGF